MTPSMYFWIAFGAVAVILLGIALFRARHGWSTGARPKIDGQTEARAAASMADLHRGPPSASF
jgi:hypothetical protein